MSALQRQLSVVSLKPARQCDPDQALCFWVARALQKEIRIATESSASASVIAIAFTRSLSTALPVAGNPAIRSSSDRTNSPSAAAAARLIQS